MTSKRHSFPSIEIYNIWLVTEWPLFVCINYSPRSITGTLPIRWKVHLEILSTWCQPQWFCTQCVQGKQFNQKCNRKWKVITSSIWSWQDVLKTVNTLRSGHPADNIFKSIIFNKNSYILFEISLNLVPKCPLMSYDYIIIDSCDGLLPNRQQTITCINNDTVHWCHRVSLGCNDLNSLKHRHWWEGNHIWTVLNTAIDDKAINMMTFPLHLPSVHPMHIHSLADPNNPWYLDTG